MSQNFPVRFQRGGGLELSAASQTQVGLLRLENAEIDLRDVISKRQGAPNVSPTTTLDPNNEIPADELRAVWHRDDELVLEARDRILSRRECSGAGTVTQGTATAQEITSTSILLDNDLETEYSYTVPLPGDAGTTEAYSRFGRQAASLQPFVHVNGIHQVTAQLDLVSTPPRVTWTGADSGSLDLPAGTARLRTRWHFLPASTTTSRLVYADNILGSIVVRVIEFELLGSGVFDVTEDRFTSFGNVLGAGNANIAFDADENSAIFFARDFSLLQVTDLYSPNNYVLTWDADPDIGQEIVFEARRAGAGLRVVAYDPSATTDDAAVFWDLSPGDTEPVPGSPIPRVSTFSSPNFGLSNLGNPILGITHQDIDDPYAVRAIAPGAYCNFVDIDGLGQFTVEWSFQPSAVVQSYTLQGVAGSETQSLGLLGGSTQISRRNSLGQHIATWQRDDGTALLYTYRTAGAIAAAEANISPLSNFHRIAAYGGDDVFAVGGLRNNPGTRFEVLYSTDLANWLGESFLDDVVPEIPGLNANNVATISAEDLGGAFRFRWSLWGGTTGLTDFTGTLFSGVRRTDTGDSNLRTDPINTLQGSSTQVIVQSGTYPRVLWGFESTSGVREIYEITDAYIVRVQPGIAALAGGNWTPRAPWTRADLDVVQTASWGSDIVRQTSSALVTSPASGDACLFQLVEIVTGPAAGVQALLYSTHAESGGPSDVVQLGLNGTSPHIANVDGDVVAYTFVQADAQLVYQFWSPGDNFVPAPMGLESYSVSSAVMDLSARRLASSGVGFLAFILRDENDDTRIHIRLEDGTVLHESIQNIPTGETAAAVACYAIDNGDDDPLVVFAQGGPVAAGGYTVNVRSVSFDATTGTPTTLWERTWIGTGEGEVGDTVHAITVGAFASEAATQARIAVEWRNVTTGDRQVDHWIADASSDTLTDTEYRSSLFSGYVEQNGRMFYGVSANDFIAQNKLRRTGIFLVSPITDSTSDDVRESRKEYVGRVNVGTPDTVETSVIRGSLRTQVSDSNVYGSTVTFGYQTVSGAVTTATTTSKAATLDFTPRPNRPGNLARVAVSAHAGYPRVYDGLTAVEHDWHELPEIRNTSLIAGGITDAGRYGVAVTWEWTDAEGNLYRSEPDFDSVPSGGGAFGIRVQARALQRTERIAAVAVAWRTLPNGAAYFRAGTIPAVTGTATITIDLTAADSEIEDEEQLDQVPNGSMIPSGPAPLTSWIATADGRYWSRDPQRRGVVRYTTFATEGYSPHWSEPLALELPAGRPATALGESDGRIVAWDVRGVATWPSGGPANDGSGGYTSPATVPSATGCQTIDSTVLIPDGYVYGTTNVPFLLTRGLSTVEVADRIYAPYERDGETVSTAAWDYDTKSLIIANGVGGRNFRLHPETLRWCEDTQRVALDQSTAQSGEYAVLTTDGRVLVRRPASRTAALYTDGDTPYQFLVSTPWIREPAQDARALGGFNFDAFTVLGEYLGPHELQARVYVNYETTPYAEFVVPAADTAAAAAAGRPYIWTMIMAGLNVWAVRIEISDNLEPNETFRLEAIDVSWNGDGGAGDAEFPSSYSFQRLP